VKRRWPPDGYQQSKYHRHRQGMRDMQMVFPLSGQPTLARHMQGMRIMPKRDPNKIDVAEALRLYHVWRNWREVACRMIRKNGMRFATDAVQAAVRRYDLRGQR
jgi:hypothetical protein